MTLLIWTLSALALALALTTIVDYLLYPPKDTTNESTSTTPPTEH